MAKTTEISQTIHSGIDYINIVVSKDEILRQDFSKPLKLLKDLIATPDMARFFKERVDIFVDGYNHCKDELWEIPEVRNYIQELDSKFPYWFYFLSKNGHGLYLIAKCFLLPFLTPEGESLSNNPILEKFLDEKFVAMNHIGDYVGLTEKENIEMTDKVIKYFFG